MSHCSFFAAGTRVPLGGTGGTLLTVAPPTHPFAPLVTLKHTTEQTCFDKDSQKNIYHNKWRLKVKTAPKKQKWGARDMQRCFQGGPTPKRHKNNIYVSCFPTTSLFVLGCQNQTEWYKLFLGWFDKYAGIYTGIWILFFFLIFFFNSSNLHKQTHSSKIQSRWTHKDETFKKKTD